MHVAIMKELNSEPYAHLQGTCACLDMKIRKACMHIFYKILGGKNYTSVPSQAHLPQSSKMQNNKAEYLALTTTGYCALLNITLTILPAIRALTRQMHAKKK